MSALVQFDRSVAVNVLPKLAAGGPGILVNPVPAGGPPSSAVPQLRVQFGVTKSTSHEANRATIQIYNLGPLERRRCDSSVIPIGSDLGIGGVIDARTATTATVQLLAGYGSALGQVFRGDTASIEHTHQDVDWVTEIRAGDGLWPLSQATANRSFDVGTPAVTVLAYLAGVLGLVLGMTQVPAALASYILQGPLVCFGKAAEALEELLGGLPVEWWVDDGVLVVLPILDVACTQADIPNATALASLPLPLVIVSPEPVPGAARLLEQPRRLEHGGARIRMLLYPSIRPGCRVSIAGQTELFGLYRAEVVSHAGDNRDGQFITEVDLLPGATV